MYVAAHQDDTLLFQSPTLVRDVQSGRCIRTVFVTAGDAGREQTYWSGREDGAEAAYAQMAGVSNQWTGSQISAGGHSLHLETLVGEPGISIVYMRLPDGGDDGQGFPRYESESLMKLWSGTEANIEAVDDSATYGRQDLIDTLAALMGAVGPQQVYTQNYTAALIGPDHPDHVATAYFAKAAQEQYEGAHRLVGFKDYETSVLPQNVFGVLLGAKQLAFYTYGVHDFDACASEGACAPTSYAKWLAREYVAGTETVGVVAHAGYAQITSPDTAVSLDGSESSSESGGPLAYLWTQTGGPAVALAGAGTVSPSIVTPPHPTLLTFSLTVRNGSTSSKPDFVRVRVPSSDPTPVAIVGPDQSVAAGATVKLDGASSWDPNSEPLSHAWLQTGGPRIALAGSSTAAPSFVAPEGPASLTFSLVVSNGSQASAPATVRVDVGGRSSGPDGQAARLTVRLSSSKVRLLVRRPSRRVVHVAPLAPSSSVTCRGALPRGARCRVNARGAVVVSGSRALKQTGDYRLSVRVENPSGEAKLPLTVRVRKPSGRSKDGRSRRGQLP